MKSTFSCVQYIFSQLSPSPCLGFNLFRAQYSKFVPTYVSWWRLLVYISSPYNNNNTSSVLYFTWNNGVINHLKMYFFLSQQHFWCININLHSKETTLELLLWNGSGNAVNKKSFFSVFYPMATHTLQCFTEFMFWIQKHQPIHCFQVRKLHGNVSQWLIAWSSLACQRASLCCSQRTKC